MVPFSFQILGANGALPLPDRFSSSFILSYGTSKILIDCGEGAQIKMSQFKVRRSKIDCIFISHMHGDHIYGLPGLINSFALNGRKEPLNIIGPTGLRDYLEFMWEISKARLSFDVTFTELSEPKPQKLGIFSGLSVIAFPLEHRILTFGYVFQEQQQAPKINPDQISAHQLSVEEIKTIKQRQSILRNRVDMAYEQFCLPDAPLRSFAYLSDTAYCEHNAEHCERADLIYHESTYLHDFASLAAERGHATSKEAATFAAKAQVKKLIIGHYSSRYKNLTPLLEEAQSVFPNTALALEGEIHEI